MPNLNTQTEYDTQLAEKVTATRREFAHLYPGEIDVFQSPVNSFRLRAEFKAWHDGDRVEYAMFRPGSNKETYIVKEFPIASPTIQKLMPLLLREINADSTLCHKLFQIEFLTSLQGDAVISLIYHCKLTGDWSQTARNLANHLDCHIIGRSRGQKIVIGNNFVMESFNVLDKIYHYQQIECSFTQPNGKVCEQMLNWVSQNTPPSAGDLLELYCGNGNFSLPLSQRFNRVLATEIAKSSIQSAQYNCILNKVSNIDFVRLSSEELSQAINGTREFQRLRSVSLSDYNFVCAFVDPPRAGLDDDTRALITAMDRIIYISCNPDTLKRDLTYLQTTHQIEKFALFDQFPYTRHRECGVILTRKHITPQPNNP